MIRVDLVIDGRRHEVTIDDDGMQVDGVAVAADVRRRGTESIVTVDDAVHVIDLADAHTALVDGRRISFDIHHLDGVEGASLGGGGALGPVRPPMTGRIDAILVAEGDEVEAGQVLFVLEAMKMRNEIKAPAAGTVQGIKAKPGDTVDGDDVILILE